MSLCAPATPAARVVGLVKTFGVANALAGISAELPPGRILGLVGPDGAGKTTLIRLLAGLMEPTAGTVEVLGRTPRAAGGTTQAQTGYMPLWMLRRASSALRSCCASPTSAHLPGASPASCPVG